MLLPTRLSAKKDAEADFSVFFTVYVPDIRYNFVPQSLRFSSLVLARIKTCLRRSFLLTTLYLWHVLPA